MTQTIESLQARIAELEAENKNLLAANRDCLDHFNAMQQDLAASQLSESRMREAFVKLIRVVPREVNCGNMHHRKADQHYYDETCPVVSRYSEAIEAADKILSEKLDTSTLDAYVAEKVKEAYPLVSAYPDQNTALRKEIAELTRQRDMAVEALQTYVDEHEECSDADDWMAMMCSVEAHHVADEALSTIKGSEKL